MSLNQRVTAEFSTCTPSAPPTAHLSIQTIRESRGEMRVSRFLYAQSAYTAGAPQRSRRKQLLLPARVMLIKLLEDVGIVKFLFGIIGVRRVDEAGDCKSRIRFRSGLKLLKMRVHQKV